jgi:hypothetical protein
MCQATRPWVDMFDCPATLLVGESAVVKVGINSSNMAQGIYYADAIFIEMDHLITWTSHLIVNVTANPVFPIPQITNVQFQPSYDSAIITWNTMDIPSNSSVFYNTSSTMLGFSRSINDDIENHIVALLSLAPDTEYFFRVKSCTQGGCDESSILRFNTTKLPAGCQYGNPPCASGYSCQLNNCIQSYSGTSTSGNTGTTGTGPAPANKNKPIVNATPTPEPQVNAEVVRLKQDLEDGLSGLSPDETSEVDAMLREAELLYKEGKTDQALIVLNRARARLKDTIAQSKTTKANFTWQIAALAVILIGGFAFYYHGKYSVRTKNVEYLPDLKVQEAMENAHTENTMKNEADLIPSGNETVDLKIPLKER